MDGELKPLLMEQQSEFNLALTFILDMILWYNNPDFCLLHREVVVEHNRLPSHNLSGALEAV